MLDADLRGSDSPKEAMVRVLRAKVTVRGRTCHSSLAPLGVNAVNMAGVAMAFAREGSGRVAISLIGEGGSSLGEWHEAINLCAARRLPAVFCIENNQTALSTPVSEQSAVRVFADKAVGYGIPGITIDGTDPDRVAAAFAWAVERARAGEGPALIELGRDYAQTTDRVAREAVDLFDHHVRERIQSEGGETEAAERRLLTLFNELLEASGVLVRHHFQRTLLRAAREHIERKED